MRNYGVALLVLAVLSSGCYKSEEAAAPVSEQGLSARQPNGVPDVAGKLASWWSGEIIVGEGAHRGKIELSARDRYYEDKSVVLQAHKDGFFYLGDVLGVAEVGDIIVKPRGLGKVPQITWVLGGRGEQTEYMSPVYGASEALREGKIAPVIIPSISPPVERIWRKSGRRLGEGYAWSVFTYSQQVYGHKDPTRDKVEPVWTDAEMAPLVVVVLKPFVVDLKDKYWSDERLARLAEADKEYDSYKFKNSQSVYRASAGEVRVVSCFGRQSTNPEAKNSGGMRYDMVQLPNGKWIAGFPMPFSISKVLEVDGNVYLCAESAILRWTGDDSLECVVSFDGEGKWSPRIKYADTADGRILGRYFEVHKSNESDFGGLLEYADGQWKFHQYIGDYSRWIESVVEDQGNLVLKLDANFGREFRSIRFAPETGSFVDL